jgi:dipeptidyl aminopeptidase/acylaminoacyl peptidase
VQQLTFGETETVISALDTGKSASFPRISPDGRFLLVTLSDYGNFSIWHKSSDLYMMDMKTGELSKPESLNSNDVESYHSWSSNGRWIVFSSRRDNGSYTIPYLAYVDGTGDVQKPFVLPQKSPEFYNYRYKSFNIPEFIIGPVTIPIRKLEKLGASEPEDVLFMEKPIITGN